MPDSLEQIAAVRADVASYRTEVAAQLGGVRDEIRELTVAFRELIKLDGDIKRTNDAVGRIGRESDDHEIRLRALEAISAKNGAIMGMSGTAASLAAGAGASLIVAIIMHAVKL